MLLMAWVVLLVKLVLVLLTVFAPQATVVKPRVMVKKIASNFCNIIVFDSWCLTFEICNSGKGA
jgi:hypothetical protein